MGITPPPKRSSYALPKSEFRELLNWIDIKRFRFYRLWTHRIDILYYVVERRMRSKLSEQFSSVQ